MLPMNMTLTNENVDEIISKIKILLTIFYAKIEDLINPKISIFHLIPVNYLTLYTQRLFKADVNYKTC